jgi:hypothetical protein
MAPIHADMFSIGDAFGQIFQLYYNTLVPSLSNIFQWLRLGVFKGANRVGVSFPSSEDGNRSSFQNVVFSSSYNSVRYTKSKNPVFLNIFFSYFYDACHI